MSRPVCKTKCNVTPVCGGQWQSSNQGNSFSCGQGNSGYNPGYGYNPAINIPPQVSRPDLLSLGTYVLLTEWLHGSEHPARGQHRLQHGRRLL